MNLGPEKIMFGRYGERQICCCCAQNAKSMVLLPALLKIVPLCVH